MSTVMRQEYRPLSDAEKTHVKGIKDKAQELYDLFASYNPEILTFTPWSSREASIARIKLEEAVMWAVKHLTG